jgi:hypothetical protein
MPSPRSRRRRSLALAAAGVVALVLSGCVGSPDRTPTPSPSESPSLVFASDEEALAAAEAAYERFLVVSSQVTGSGGQATATLNEVATGEAYQAQIETASDYARDGIRSTGRRAFTTFRLQSHSSDGSEDGVIVAFYVCDDLRGLEVLDATGKSVVAPDRIVDVPYLVVVEGKPNALKVSERDLWDRDNFCV